MYLFTTCRKFKGLEADVVILIDVDSSNLGASDDKNLYVGASRAKFELGIVAVLSENECKEICSLRELSAKRNYQKARATSINSKLLKMEL